MDIRQDTGRLQCGDESEANLVTGVTGPEQTTPPCFSAFVRTLDLYPRVPEFLMMARIDVPGDAEPAGGDDGVTIT